MNVTPVGSHKAQIRVSGISDLERERERGREGGKGKEGEKGREGGGRGGREGGKVRGREELATLKISILKNLLGCFSV